MEPKPQTVAFLEGREGDVFISYASIDDQPFAGAEKGWVTTLAKDLDLRINQVLGQRPKIWWDRTDLKGNDELSTLERVLSNTGALLSIVSPGFIESKWCKREVEAFCKKDGGRLDVPGENKFRIFKVIKIPVPRTNQFKEIQETLPYDFFQFVDQGHTIELAPGSDPVRTQRYVAELCRLADQIAKLLRTMKDNVSARPPKAAVYLAEATSDLREARNQLADDLQQRNFQVLPDQELDRDSTDYRKQVAAYLERSVLSVHFLGEKYGAIPEGELESHVAVQAQLAAARCSDPRFRRVIWMPPDLQPVDEAQGKLIAKLENEPAGHIGTEIVQKRLEHLKEDLQAWLAEITAPAAVEIPAAGIKRVYVIVDPSDIESGAADPLLDAIEQQEFELRLSPQSKDPAELLSAHQNNLATADACLIYYGTGSDAWAQMRSDDLQKTFGTRQYPVRALYVAGPENRYKKHFNPSGIQVIREQQSFSPASLANFFQAVRNAARPSA